MLIAVVLGACISPVMTFGEGKSAKQAQRDTMTSFGPARLATGEKWSGEVTTRKVRVWADNQYRAQNRQWQQTFEEPLGLANLVITPLFGLALTAEYTAWERDVPGATLGDALAALQEQDPGEHVFAVIGLTSSLPLVSATFDQLGLATVGGRHMVMRGYADLEERKMYANAFPDLRADERELALVHLRHHKTAVILLHELGHILGVAHEPESTTIMNASYSNHATSFSAYARDAMLRSVDQRLGRESASPILAVAPPRPSPSAVVDPWAPGAAGPHAPVVVAVTRQGTLVVAGKELDAEALDALLKETFAQDPKTTIIVSQSRKVPAGVVGALLDRAKAIGFTSFEFAWSGR